MTSQVWFADPNGTWVRTLSRFYLLGPQLKPLDEEDLTDLVKKVISGFGSDGEVGGHA